MKIIKAIVFVTCFTYSMQFTFDFTIQNDIDFKSEQNIEQNIEHDHALRLQAVQLIEEILHKIIDGENKTSLLHHLDEVQNVKHHFCPIKDKKHLGAIEHFVINKDELIHTPNNFMPSLKNISKPIRLYKAYCHLPGKKPKYESTKKVIKILFEKCDQASQELKTLQISA